MPDQPNIPPDGRTIIKDQHPLLSNPERDEIVAAIHQLNISDCFGIAYVAAKRVWKDGIGDELKCNEAISAAKIFTESMDKIFDV